MPELLLEILSEEIPARMQARAASDLERLMKEKLLAAGFLPEGLKAFATPRRLALVATGLPARQPDRREEKKGPRLGAPDKAIEGFLKSVGLSSLQQCEVREDKKGSYFVAVIDQKGRDTAALIAEAVGEIIRDFPWPKSMRWGEGDLKWVRPIHSILCCFDGEVVPFAVDGIKAGDRTVAHRFMGGDVRARSFDKYAAALKKGKVILDAEERNALIAAEARTLCEAQGLQLVADETLLSEVAGLAEWPVVMMGSFDAKFLALPDEVLTATMRGHQKYFSARDPKTGRLANRFIFVSNLEAPDGGAAMRPGYQRVLTARLSDAWYLYRKDLRDWSARASVEDFVRPLERVTFFEGLGAVADKARRVAALAKEIAPLVGADPPITEEAALLAKADLTSGMVYEFPELQGIMGRYYWLDRSARPPGEAAHAESAFGRLRDAVASHDIADAIRDHYKPKGQDDDAPVAPVSIAVALADRIDTLAAFWLAGKKPTGSGDPYALRRAALGAIATILSAQLRLRLRELAGRCFQKLIPFLAVLANKAEIEFLALVERLGMTPEQGRRVCSELMSSPSVHGRAVNLAAFLGAQETDLLGFFHDRLKAYLRDKGHRYDQIDAALARADGSLEDDLVFVVRKLEALELFLKSDDGANLAIAYKRAVNILKAEEKKIASAAPRPFARAVEPKLLQITEEWGLFKALVSAEDRAAKAVHAEKFEEAMAALAALRSPVDAFFDKVTVNDKDERLRANRLALLERFRSATTAVADLSKLEG